MADGPSLGDFFAKKKKKNLHGSNLNKEAANPKAEEKPQGKTKKDKEEDGWEDEQIVAPTMMVAVAGTLTREEETQDQQNNSAAAWGKKKEERGNKDLNERKFPTLAKAMRGKSSAINIDDGSNPNINIKTSKNIFAALDNDEEDDDDEDAPKKRPKEIKPAMVSKVKGEFAKDAIKREVDKYAKTDAKKGGKKPQDDDDEDEDEEEREEEEQRKAEARAVKKKEKKQAEKKAAEEEEEEVEEDTKIEPDLVASKEKYSGRQKLPTVPLPQKDIDEEKKAPKQPVGQAKGKKKRFVMEEEEKPKLQVVDW